MYMYIYIYTHIYSYIYKCIFTYIRICICTYTYHVGFGKRRLFFWTHAQAWARHAQAGSEYARTKGACKQGHDTLKQWKYKRTHRSLSYWTDASYARTHAQTHTHTRAQTHTRTHACTHTKNNSHAHTHMHADTHLTRAHTHGDTLMTRVEGNTPPRVRQPGKGRDSGSWAEERDRKGRKGAWGIVRAFPHIQW